MATTQVHALTLPGWVRFTNPGDGVDIVRASLCAEGIQIEIPTPRRGLVSVVLTTTRFAALEPIQASHAEALDRVLYLLGPERAEKALALVLGTCEDAAEAYGDGLPETAEALSRFSAAWRGTSID